MPYMPLLFRVLAAIRDRYGEEAMTPIYNLVDEYMSMKQEFVNFGRLNALIRFADARTDLKRAEFLRLRVDVSNGRPEAILIRSLPLLTTLDRTNQLNDAIALMFHDDMEVRRTAIKTVISLCELIMLKADRNSMEKNDVSSTSKRLDSHVSYAVERILDVAVADREPEIRFASLEELSPSFYPYLCLPDNLDALFMTRNDNDRKTRDQSLVLLCKLHPYHPAIVHPQLVRAQEFMLRDVDGQDSSIAQAIYKASLLQMCAEHNCLLLQPNMVENVVLRRLSQHPFISKKISIALLGLLKAVLEHTSPQYHCDSFDFVRTILSIINNGDCSTRRCAALETLASILTTLTVTDSNLRIDMYRCIARIIRWEAEEQVGVTLAAINVFATIGAVNPVKIRSILTVLNSDGIEEEEEAVTPALAQYKPHLRVHPKMAERYPSVVLYYLVKSLQLSIDPRLQVDTLVTLRLMMQEVPSTQKAVLLTQLLPQLKTWLTETDRAYLFEIVLCLMCDLAALLRQCKESIPSSTGYELLRSVQLFCMLPQAAQKPLSTHIVQLLDDLAKGLPAQDMRDNRWAVEFIHQRLSQNKNDLDLIHRVVKALESFLVVMHEKDLQLILPHVLQCIEPAKTTPAARRPKMKDINDACFDFLNNIMVKQQSLLKDCCAQIVHTIMWYIDLSDNQEEMDIGLTTLASLIDVIKQPAKRFIQPVERVAEQNGYPKGYFQNLVNSAASGMKVRAPPYNTENLNPDLPLSLVSHLPRLTQKEFETELRNTLRMADKDFTVLDVTHPSGQTVINFRFCPGNDQTACFNLFTRKAQDTKSSLRRNLGILKVEQCIETPKCIDVETIEAISAIPEATLTRREQSWISWLHSSSFLLLKASPYSPLRCCANIADRSSELIRDLFPFAASAIIGQLEVKERKTLVDIFNRAILMAPYDIKLILFSLAEFLESERGEKKATLVHTQKQKVFSVKRDTADMKFGINYDQDPSRGVVVTKLAPKGLGESAGVPVGGQLLSINGCPVLTVGDIRGMIDGLLQIDLNIAFTVEERFFPEPKYLMDLDTLATISFKSQMHTKAIYFNEILFEKLFGELKDVTKRDDAALHAALRVSERLIEFYGHLNLSMVAHGLVQMITKKFSNDIVAPDQFGFDEIGTLEQLHWWDEALRRYQRRLESLESPKQDMSAVIGELRCEDALGNVEAMSVRIAEYWNKFDHEEKRQIVSFRAKAALALGSWELFDELSAKPYFLCKFPTVEHCAALFRQGKYDQLLQYTNDCRSGRIESFSESFNESYSRAYDDLVLLQHYKHFEELVSYVNSNQERRNMLKSLWYRRMISMSAKPLTVRTIISINSLVLKPEEDVDSHVFAIGTFAKSHWYQMANRMITNILGDKITVDLLVKQPPSLIHAYAKFLYEVDNPSEAYYLLKHLLKQVKVDSKSGKSEKWGQCWQLLGEWTMHLFPDQGDQAIEELLRATKLSPTDFAAFHSLGILHYDLSRDPSTPQQVQTDHHIASVIALFKSVQLSSDNANNVMQDVLRILSVWFSHSAVEELNEAVEKGVQLLSDFVWLNVIPQLIARIGITAKHARAILADLLVRVGTKYPEALIYPLTVAEKSPDATRRVMAERVLTGIRATNSQMVEGASLISNEMVRIAILWTEKWHAAIQQAAHKPDNTKVIEQCFGNLYELLDRPFTPNERNFEKTFGQTLRRAKACLQDKLLDKAWTFLKQVYGQLTKMLSDRRLYMSDVSPTLDNVRESIVAVPGTFKHDRLPITIDKFHSRVYVMPSKQKPRRLGLDASDGLKYRFLLKGHEDLRQDERVMQFVGLVDSIFVTDNSTSSIGLSLPQYAVIPLTDNVGLIGWVENTETIYKMLENYRSEHNISIYEEVNIIMKQGALKNIEDYHRQTKQIRKGLLNYAMERTPSDEVRRIIWDRNDSCEQWLSYRGTYGYTLAAMSMVGYVLGLGDRHLNNLMLKENGTVVHIDFGDCFEVAMHRALYAEAVPFRLTRLLVTALGITGVNGVYRLTCELVMRILRRHSENLLSILEAFIYDPLINWRLNVNDAADRSSSRQVSDPETGAQRSGNEVVLGEQENDNYTMQLSKSFAKRNTENSVYAPYSQGDGANTLEYNEEETRNQQGDLALARVHAKLTGQDFGLVNSSFSLSSRQKKESFTDSLQRTWPVNHDNVNPEDDENNILTSYLSLRALTGTEDSLNVNRQVDKLIKEAPVWTTWRTPILLAGHRLVRSA
ncbi:FKBP12-rapamycin complex-associated protein [Angomonas deanei]|uniref:non-specific serine/threonine protein kinase n=1 Tax=Angomonas deanei TaxID=59799 RepID=A0A7G2C5N8_9TRYP|nr:FKBP12-rapamycin complex-associated protein [Angomonas deanei]CAD2214805.1 Domain of unknown function (DUF3385)/FAT domain/FKBP12-rapamycin binding domain/Phosphatidylinositol 3- and 4-kinase, putative [Angomonas deanei]|eukprot:EPY29908.1 FKBP12-rapamycin complex-associated protein [Angomonas deanei]